MKSNLNITNTSKSPFPSIDFNFRNNGNVSALISKFTIIIESCKIDLTPVFDFYFDVKNGGNSFMRDNTCGDFIVYSTNNGWGDAKEIEFNLENQALQELFSKNDLTFRGNLGSTNTNETFRLKKEKIQVNKFKELQSHLRKVEFKKLEERLPEFLSLNEHMTVENGYKKGALEESYEEHKAEEINKFNRQWEIGIPLTDILVNKIYVVKSPIVPHHHKLFVTEKGFILHENFLDFCINHSDANYCSLIDVDKPLDSKSYRISRKIPPNDLDRFHITIGATKSCQLNIRFQFTIDSKKKVSSEEFIIKIWNPNNSGFLRDYKDGEVIMEEWNLQNYNFLIENEPKKNFNRFGFDF